MAENTKAKINGALDTLVDETIRRLSDPVQLEGLTTGEITQLIYALNSARDAGTLTKLKAENVRLKRKFDGKSKPKTEARRQPTWAG